MGVIEIYYQFWLKLKEIKIKNMGCFFSWSLLRIRDVTKVCKVNDGPTLCGQRNTNKHSTYMPDTLPADLFGVMGHFT